jgi:hypothetical protein
VKDIRMVLHNYIKEKTCIKLLKKYKNLNLVIDRVNRLSESTGVAVSDFIFLYHYIRERAPKYILECGTGRSTWIIAQAIIDNNNGVIPDEFRIVSMESVDKWHKHALDIFPDEWKTFCDIRLSNISTYQIGLLRGTCYSIVPNLPYELVFVDGPSQKIDQIRTVNMDFIKCLQELKTPVTAVIDERTSTIGGYSLILKKGKVKYYPSWGLGIVDNVNQNDLIYRNKIEVVKNMRQPLLPYTYKNLMKII